MRQLLMIALAVALVGATSLAVAEGEGEPKYTRKQVMQKAMKAGLCKKVASGQGTAEDAKMLLELFKALAANKPKKGDEESWKEKTGALVKAAQQVVDGKEGGTAALGKAANCKACHTAHR